MARLSKSEQMVVRLERRLHDAGYREIQAVQMGYFFRKPSSPMRPESVPGIAIADFSDISFPHPQRAESTRPAGSVQHLQGKEAVEDV